MVLGPRAAMPVHRPTVRAPRPIASAPRDTPHRRLSGHAFGAASV